MCFYCTDSSGSFRGCSDPGAIEVMLIYYSKPIKPMEN